MAIHNTDSDAANTAVRAFLTEVGEYYLGRTFNTGTGQGRNDWIHIKDIVFEGRCAYCGKSHGTLQIEHLIMFNKSEYGLHHPGNIVPCCGVCNKRGRNEDKSYKNWIDHLRDICTRNGELDQFEARRARIEAHMTQGKYRYPDLSEEEMHAIRVIANSLYSHIKTELEQSLDLYTKLREAFVRKD
jgi:hypothetical protein